MFGGSSSSEKPSPFGKFGTPDDFKAAIAELGTALAANKVSTDPEVVKAHGFSANVSSQRFRNIMPYRAHHPSVASRTILPLRIRLLSSLKAQKMSSLS